jgi:hypothetical protein
LKVPAEVLIALALLGTDIQLAGENLTAPPTHLVPLKMRDAPAMVPQ